ncbi:MAG TPA: carboxylesterase family protein [Dehalococcoidia bacterium]|nr:carboxylesterase family protein [Dehalococcoidia bacterium]
MKNGFWYKLLVPFLVLMLIVSVTVSCNGTEGEQEEEEEEEVGEQEEEEEEEEEEESTLLVDPIMTDSGLVSGTLVDDAGEEVRVYKGIPFAAPPVGDLRWEPPQSVEPWEGVLECTDFAPIAPQVTSSDAEQSEDCLYLNVYTPAKNTTDRLPVFVSIHGGAMVIGSSRSPDMTYFARTNNVVGVSIAYRLGGLGFFAHPLLSEESENEVSGNYGLMDQVAALEWVQENIAAFGGDPDNVTIHGCSSGGESVLFLMASPFSEGLFHQAIADAGVYGETRTPPLAEMEVRGENLAVTLGVSEEPDVLAALRALSADEIVAAVPVSTSGTELQLPNVDGWFLPDYPLNVFEAGDQQNVPLMIGSGSADLAGEWNQYGDKNFACAMSSVSSLVYAWVFDHAPCGSGGGTHCLDMTYLFAEISTLENMCDVDIEVSEAMVTMWVQFARTGDPNIEGLIEWPAYEEDTDQYLEIGDPLQVETGLYEPGKYAEEEPPSEAVTYTNDEYGFSLEYPGNWNEKTADLGPGVIWRVGAGTYFVPAVRIIVRDESEGATLEEVFTVHLTEDGDKTIDTYIASDVTINDTDVTQAEVAYTGSSGGYESMIIGLIKDGKWIIIEVYTVPAYFPFADEGQPAEIIGTVTFE